MSTNGTQWHACQSNSAPMRVRAPVGKVTLSRHACHRVTTCHGFRLHLQSLPSSDVPEAIRMRRALKTLLRSFGFRCTGIERKGIAQASQQTASEIIPAQTSTRQTGGKRERQGNR